MPYPWFVSKADGFRRSEELTSRPFSRVREAHEDAEEATSIISAPEVVDVMRWTENLDKDLERARVFVRQATTRRDEQEKWEQPKYDRLWASIRVPDQTRG